MALPDSIQAFVDRQADEAPGRYEDLRAIIFNGTTKRSPERSHTDGLLAMRMMSAGSTRQSSLTRKIIDPAWRMGARRRAGRRDQDGRSPSQIGPAMSR